jgi:hypothetical protein
MRADDLKPCILWCECFSYGKGDNGGEISGEEVLLSCLQLPVLDLLELSEAVVLEVAGEPFDCVIGGDCVVDEGEEGVGEVAAAREERLHVGWIVSCTYKSRHLEGLLGREGEYL